MNIPMVKGQSHASDGSTEKSVADDLSPSFASLTFVLHYGVDQSLFNCINNHEFDAFGFGVGLIYVRRNFRCQSGNVGNLSLAISTLSLEEEPPASKEPHGLEAALRMTNMIHNAREEHYLWSTPSSTVSTVLLPHTDRVSPALLRLHEDQTTRHHRRKPSRPTAVVHAIVTKPHHRRKTSLRPLHSCMSSPPRPTCINSNTDASNKAKPESDPLNSTTGGRNHESDVNPTTSSPPRPLEIHSCKTGGYFLQDRWICREFQAREERETTPTAPAPAHDVAPPIATSGVVKWIESATSKSRG
ncbi:hypothetical protein KSP40_PGU009267 [Platanthera guangdongensis]|uniref:Uncharacterized protein n=1 Tax=Platanthera guangdongensis TaxID=2320717 RepID=A0ABR2LXD0_9ASPA